MEVTATGITRRMDDLGRVVIPKEIRETMSLREGDPLEIFVNLESNTVCFKAVRPKPLSFQLRQVYDTYIEDMTEVEKELFGILISKVKERG